MKRKLLFAALVAVLGSLNIYAQQTPVDGGVYYLYNTANGKFLTRGNNWGTQAVTNDFGSPWKVYLADGKYTLRMHDIVTAEGNTNRALGTNGFSDNDNAAQHVKWTLTGDANAYKLSYDDGGTKYLCSPNNYGDNVIYTDANFNTTWQFLNVSEYNAVLAAKKSAQETAIATTAGIDLGGSTLATVVEDAVNWRRSDASSSVPFPSKSSWNRTNVPNRAGDTNEGSYGVENYQGGGTYSYTATGLAKGIYKVGIRAMLRSTSNGVCSTIGDAGYVNSSAYFSANGNLVQVKDWYSSRVSADNPNSTGAFVDIANNGGYYSEVYTYVGDDGNLELKAVSESYWGGSWFLFNGVTLTYYSNSVSDGDINALIETIPTRVSSAQATAMNNAKNTLLSEKTIANYNALAAAITAAQTSVNEYAIIDAGIVPTNNTAGWAKSTTNGGLACNTWSTEGNSDGSGMTTPFIQDWVASGTPLAGGNAGGKLYYSFTDLTPGETYVVTARVRVFNESGTGVTGATYFVGDNSKPLDETFSSPCVGDFATKGRFAVLSCAGTVDANGDLQFGIELASDSPINWMSIKDVTIAEGTGAVPTAITLNETSLSLTTGSSFTLESSITPSNADDKTTLWTSSDETVATVAGGTVVALKAGTATITANAYAGTSVTASCTVTVADAAAPSFYSTTIEAKDYYIMNAATGQFLGGANDWGTRAGLIEHGIPFTAAVGDGTYTLDSHTYNNATDHFLNGTYVDGASTNLYIKSLGDGKFAISTADGSAYLTAIAGSTVVANTAANTASSFAQWYFLSKNDRDKMLASTPADATYYVKQANISRNLSAGTQGQNAWSQYSVDGTQDNTNFAAQVYNAAVDNYQTIENIPNGTYQVTVQAFTSGTDVKFYANDQKVAIRNNDSGAASCSAAAALFAKGLYPNTVTVTVTDRTLKIGFEGDCSGAKWLCYDRVEMYMTNYVPVTGVTADDVEVQIGMTESLNAATTPAAASFNKLTFTSADESVATVNENGIVTGVAVGSTTITVTANEMENFSKTVDVNVTLLIPDAFALSETEVELDKENTSATLTITPTPAAANTAATWTSSDESVATVVDGVVTAVSTGTATITATSVVDAEVSAQATVSVDFPETVTPASYYVNNDATRTVYTLGDNLIKNGTFEYPDGFYGWTDATAGAAKLTSSNFDIVTDGENKYLKSKNHGGSTSASSIGTAWPIEAGKTYVFGYKAKAVNPGTTEYHVVSLTNTLATETSKISTTQTVGTAWTDIQYTFTNSSNYAYLQFRARWLGENGQLSSFDDFYLAEVTPATEGNVDYATAAIPTANIGTGAFQYSQDAIDNANALVQGVATVEDVENAYDALTTLNAPAAGKLYNVVNVSDGYNHNGKAVTFKSASNADLSGNTTSFGYNENPGSIYPQGFKFTAVGGVKNGYKLSYTRADGYEVFVGTGSSTGLGSNNDQIRPTTDASKAVTVQVVATTTENVWNLYNTLASKNIGANGANDQGFYTVASYNSMKIQEAVENEVALNITAANQYGTLILPFNANVPDGVTAYSVSTTSGATLELNEEDAFVSNTPYIVFAESGASSDLAGLGAAYTDAGYTEGLLTGVYANTPAPKGSYVLQNNDSKIGFYLVNTEVAQPTVGANRCYLTVPAGVKANAFFFNEATGIQNVLENLQAGEIYDISGRKLGKLQKGVNIVNGKKVLVK